MSEHTQWQFRIDHILKAINELDDFTNGLSYEEFLEDQKTIRAVERNFEIIGETVKHIPESIQNQHPEVPWKSMKGMRNFLAHQYDGVREIALWKNN